MGHRKWTKDICIRYAKQCISRKEFKEKFYSQFKSAYREGWLDECCIHMERLSSNINRLIYSIEFEDNSVYVGLTYNVSRRFNSHLKDINSSVYQHIQKTGLQPKLKELTGFFIKETASKKEEEFLNYYINEGWNVLNRVKTGGLGGSVRIWTKEKCLEISLTCKYRKDFKKKNNSAYNSARINNWIGEICSHMEYKQKPTWTFINCKIEAKKYKTRSEFFKKSCGAYLKSQREKWLNDVCSHMI